VPEAVSVPAWTLPVTLASNAWTQIRNNDAVTHSWRNIQYTPQPVDLYDLSFLFKYWHETCLVVSVLCFTTKAIKRQEQHSAGAHAYLVIA
jgi:hypothetical protein